MESGRGITSEQGNNFQKELKDFSVSEWREFSRGWEPLTIALIKTVSAQPNEKREAGNKRVLSILEGMLSSIDKEDKEYFRCVIEVLSLPQDALKRLNYALLLNELEDTAKNNLKPNTD